MQSPVLVFPILFAEVTAATQQAAAQSDSQAKIHSYQDDTELVCTPAAAQDAMPAFTSACDAVGLRPNLSKGNVALGRSLHIASVPNFGMQVSHRPVVLRHGGPLPLPVIPARESTPSSILAVRSPELCAIVAARAKFFQRLRELHGAGLPEQVCLGLLQARIGADCGYLARTCGIPDADARALDDALESEVLRYLGEGPRPPTAATLLAARPADSAVTSRTFLPGRERGLGFKVSGCSRLLLLRPLGTPLRHCCCAILLSLISQIWSAGVRSSGHSYQP